MAPAAPRKVPGTGSGVSDADAGGVWAQTSAKRDRLSELKIELPEDKVSLDQMATPAQALDLHLADGLGLVARAVDGAWGAQRQAGADPDAGSALACEGPLAELERYLCRTEEEGQPGAALGSDRYDAHLAEAARILAGSDGGAASPAEVALLPRAALVRVGDFRAFDPEAGGGEGGGAGDEAGTGAGAGAAAAGPEEVLASLPPEVERDLRGAVAADFDNCAAYLRLLVARHAAELMREAWFDLTRYTDNDVDRAAMGRGDDNEDGGGAGYGRRNASSLPLTRVNAVLRAYASGTCSDRVEALWDLTDKDGDGLLDEAEMDALAHLSMRPVEGALRQIFGEILDAVADPPAEETAGDKHDGAAQPPEKKGWMQRRAEAKKRKGLVKLFGVTVARHFEQEVESPHRLRCIYAWADKAHQDGKIESVHIEAGTIAGRKRYVELPPKISVEEFQSVQKEHFSHLDRVGEEIVSSFREDLLVEQGKGRQWKELKRDTGLFLLAVSIVDAVIYAL